MTAIMVVSATVFFWTLAIGGMYSGATALTCAFLPPALGMTYVVFQGMFTRYLHLRLDGRSPAWTSSRAAAKTFRITHVDASYVEFEHPEDGSRRYGILQDLSCLHGVEMIESLGGRRYRMHVSRNPENAVKALEAAYQFRTAPKTAAGEGAVLRDCPGYETLYQEALRNLD